MALSWNMGSSLHPCNFSLETFWLRRNSDNERQKEEEKNRNKDLKERLVILSFNWFKILIYMYIYFVCMSKIRVEMHAFS